jgi:hypothetical protein
VLAAIVTLVIGAAVVAFPASGAVARNGPSMGCRDATSRSISVAVSAPAGLSESLLNRIFAEAEAIWKPVGITFDWHPIVSTRRGGSHTFSPRAISRYDAVRWANVEGFGEFFKRETGRRAHVLQRPKMRTGATEFTQRRTG